MNEFRQDCRYGFRMLARSPGFTAVAVLSLAIGIGVNSAVFSIIDVALLRTLPFPEPDRLAAVWEVPPDRPDQSIGTWVGGFAAWAEQNQVFEHFAGSQWRTQSLEARDNPEVLNGQRVTLDYLPALKVQPLLGRWFIEEDYEVGSTWPVILSYDCWQRRYAGDPNVLGKTLPLEGSDHVVIGVMPPNFRPPLWRSLTRDLQFWTPFRFEAFNFQSKTRYVPVVARLKPGVSIQESQAAMNVVAAEMERRFPDNHEGWGIRVEPLHEALTSNQREPLLVLWGVVGLVLLIGCANVAGLLLGRASARHREIAIRASLGASRMRIARQLLTESLLLGLIGGALGLLLARVCLVFLVAAAPPELPEIDDVSIGLSVLGYALLLSVLTGVVAGIFPVMRSSGPKLNDALKDAGRSGGPSPSKHALRGALVIGEVALASVVLVSSGLLLNSFLRLTGVDPGFDEKRLFSFSVRLPHTIYSEDAGAATGYHMSRVGAHVAPLFQTILGEIRAVPGVESASLSDYPPMRGWSFGSEIKISGRPEPASTDKRPRVEYHAVGAAFFDTLGVSLLRGRSIDEGDNYDAPWTVVINQEAARLYWPDRDPVGDSITFQTEGEERPRQIVGVVGNVRYGRLDEPPTPQAYVSDRQQALYTRAASVSSQLQRTFLLRTAVDPNSLLPSLQRIISEHTGNQPIYSAATIEALRNQQLSGARFAATLMTGFAGVAAFLAAVGLFALMAYSVVLRTREFGLRMALGAQRVDVLRLVLRQGLLLGLAGIALGLALSYGATRVLASRLYEITPTDGLTLVMVSCFFLAVIVLACFVPTRRATRVDPMVALRHE